MQEEIKKIKYLLSKGRMTSQEEALLLAFVREHVNPNFKKGCNCKGGSKKLFKAAKSAIAKIEAELKAKEELQAKVQSEGLTQCAVCDTLFKAKNKNHKYCSEECRNSK